ncbi:histidine kinase [Actinoplanes sp. ATCC 53533]|uniref:GAF and ANTAR domain-containing protein n=1 Tax=Actinoplanes sp. ATCC 53533 TaxID=1288362 RepID=UPI000F7A4C54|nr:GAF and ANTAR domain-containing protein [Actinoplanes sp. ATCC 53533]RSM68488.1 histidine kinase [Actinoplanes sp. ATCC 53533]
MSSDRLDPTAALAELGRISLAENDLHGVLTRVADLARRTVPGAEEVSMTLVRGGAAETAAYTGPLALILDEWQYRQGVGPCLAAAAGQATVSAPDLAGDQRWPGWTERAVEAGVRSSLSVGLPIEEHVDGALNLYGVRHAAFDRDAVTLAETFAGYAAVALANVNLYAATAKLARQLETAMASRAVIEQAKGIIMGSRRCTADEAFAILTAISQNSNRKLRDVAAALVAEARNGGDR